MGMKHLYKHVYSQLWISHFNSNFIGLSQVICSSYSVHKSNYFRKNLWLAIRQITHLLFLLVGQPIRIILVVVLENPNLMFAHILHSKSMLTLLQSSYMDSNLLVYYQAFWFHLQYFVTLGWDLFHFCGSLEI